MSAVARAAGRRRGLTVALIGCDGAGKTTVARALERDPALGARYLYMGVSADSSDRMLPSTRVAHAVKRARGRRAAATAAASSEEQPPRRRSRARAALRVANRIAEEWYRELLARTYRARGAIVVFDRHFLADYHAIDVVGEGLPLSRRIHGWMLSRAYPRPDLAVFLDAPPEVLHARKGEGTIASLARRRADYLGVVASGEVAGTVAVVSATQPLGAVVDQVAGLIRTHAGR
jgi:thymidylate kinase